MTARYSSAMDKAIKAVRAGSSQIAAARKFGLAPSSVWRACRTLKIPATRGRRAATAAPHI